MAFLESIFILTLLWLVKKDLDKKKEKLVAEYLEIEERYEKIEKIKNNLDIYLGKNRKIEKKPTWIESIKNNVKVEEEKERRKKPKKRVRDEMEL